MKKKYDINDGKNMKLSWIYRICEKLHNNLFNLEKVNKKYDVDVKKI